ncbi:hypothetical protein CAJAP_08421 [Camponotus japonicus]
MLKNG